MNLLEALGQAIRIPELRRKLLFTSGCWSRSASSPHRHSRRQPGGAQRPFSATRCSACSTSSAAAACSASRSSRWALNPYINATIIMQLMTVVSVRLKELSKEGSRPQEDHALHALAHRAAGDAPGVRLPGAVHPTTTRTADHPNPTRRPRSASSALTAGTMIAMWLGELITEYGVGNGVSLIIFVGIIGRLPAAIVGYGGTGGTGHIVQLVVMALIAVAVTAARDRGAAGPAEDTRAIGATSPQRANRRPRKGGATSYHFESTPRASSRSSSRSRS